MIGGAEDKTGDCEILARVARRTGARALIVCTAGSVIPQELFELYKPVFRRLGVRAVTHAAVPNREDADDSAIAASVIAAGAFFFTGGDQLEITTKIGGTAGASALGHTMPVSTVEDEHRVAAASQLLPGMALIENVIVDQHFAQRGRMGRLIAGVAENPRLLGIGIDENTAIVWHRGFSQVIGTGAVYVVDGAGVSGSNVGEGRGQSAISAFDLRLHVLSAGDAFDAAARRPIRKPRLSPMVAAHTPTTMM